MVQSTQQAFGLAVRARRAEVGITLEQLAQACGVSPGALSRIERGTLNTGLQNAVAIASSLGSELSELLAPTPELLVLRSDEGQVYVDPATGIRRKLLARPTPGTELIHYTLPAQTATAALAPHRPRTTETFHVTTGRIRITSDAVEPFTLETGDTAQTPGDHHHQIDNLHDVEATVIILTVSPR